MSAYFQQDTGSSLGGSNIRLYKFESRDPTILYRIDRPLIRMAADEENVAFSVESAKSIPSFSFNPVSIKPSDWTREEEDTALSGCIVVDSSRLNPHLRVIPEWSLSIDEPAHE